MADVVAEEVVDVEVGAKAEGMAMVGTVAEAEAEAVVGRDSTGEGKGDIKAEAGPEAGAEAEVVLEVYARSGEFEVVERGGAELISTVKPGNADEDTSLFPSSGAGGSSAFLTRGTVAEAAGEAKAEAGAEADVSVVVGGVGEE
jgi:hypothetical protein